MASFVSSSFVVGRPLGTAGTCAFTHRARVEVVRRRSQARVQMNIFGRFFRVLRANANKLVSGLEDPEKLINQTVEEMEADLVKVRQAYAEVFAQTKRLEKQKAQAEQMSNEWYKRAQLALEKSDENLAREALTRRKQFEETVQGKQAQLGPMQQNVTKLYTSMQALESKIGEARSQKDQYIARARTAATTQKVNQMLGNVGDTSSMAAFEKMKQKVEELEISSEVSGELSSGKDQTLEDKFRVLEGQSDVEDELLRMKKELGSGQKWPLPSDPSIDNELEKMRRERGY